MCQTSYSSYKTYSIPILMLNFMVYKQVLNKWDSVYSFWANHSGYALETGHLKVVTIATSWIVASWNHGYNDHNGFYVVLKVNQWDSVYSFWESLFGNALETGHLKVVTIAISWIMASWNHGYNDHNGFYVILEVSQ